MRIGKDFSLVLLDPFSHIFHVFDAEIGNAVGANDDAVNFPCMKQAMIEIQLIAHLLHRQRAMLTVIPHIASRHDAGVWRHFTDASKIFFDARKLRALPRPIGDHVKFSEIRPDIRNAIQLILDRKSVV